MDWQAINATLAQGELLTTEQIDAVSAALLEPEQDNEQKKQFLSALSERGEQPEEIAQFVRAFLRFARKPQLEAAAFTAPLLDIVGTGGDQMNLFNVSTTSLFVAVGAGAYGVKHGNRAITSKSGGADVLEALGVQLDLAPERFGACLQAARCGFLFAPVYHPGFAAVAPVRKELAREGKKTLFNLLGPLLNPAQVDHMLVGVAEPRLLRPFAEIFRHLGRRRILVICGQSERGRWMDEGSIVGPTRCALLENEKITEFIIEAGELGLSAQSSDELTGGDSARNASILTGILSQELRAAPRDMVLFNSALALRAAGIAPTLEVGIEQARQAIESGQALAALKALQSWHAQERGS